MNMEEDKVLGTTVKDLLIEIFSDAKEKSTDNGMIATMRRMRGELETLAKSSRDRTLSLIFLDIHFLIILLISARDSFIKEYVKNELKEGLERGLERESFDILSEMVDSLDFDQFRSSEGDYIVAEKLLEKFKPVSPSFPSEIREKVFLELVNSMQTGFLDTVHRKFPELMEDFFRDVLSAIKDGSIENVLELLEEEKLRWHSRVAGYP